MGIDIGDYNITKTSIDQADQYIITTPDDFHEAITSNGDDCFDAVISAHNLEHCNRPADVIAAICRVIKPGGLLYMSFPSEASVGFPSRKRCLNFFDDPTHQTMPNWRDVSSQLENAGFEFVFSTQRHRPVFPFLIGLLFEPISMITKIKAPFNGTWALYGFESVLCARKKR